MGDHKTPGMRTANRLASRSEGIRRQAVQADGGEVYTGALASRALRAVGARAMTLEGEIVVDEGFDTSKAEDQALYAHERFHQAESGGEGAVLQRDAEEVAARAIERMVLHRSQKGDSFDSIMRDVNTTGSAMREAATGATGPGPSSKNGSMRQQQGEGPTDEAKTAYLALLAEGKTHEMIVKDLARYVLLAMDKSHHYNMMRVAPSKTM
jgi:hypothetical protein